MAALLRVKRLWAVKSRLQLTDSQVRYRVAPIGCYHRRRSQHEVTVAKGRVGDGEIVLGPHSARPQQDVEIECPRLPSLAAPDTTEMCLYLLQPVQQVRRRHRGRDKRGGIGIASARRPKRCAAEYGGMRKDVDVIHFERGNRLLDDFGGRADYRMWLVGTDADEVKVGQIRYPRLVGHTTAACDHGRNPCWRGVRALGRDRRWQGSCPFRYRRGR
jgi:hypothetical protein